MSERSQDACFTPSHKARGRNIAVMCVTKALASVWCVKCSHQMCLHIIHNNLTFFFQNVSSNFLTAQHLELDSEILSDYQALCHSRAINCWLNERKTKLLI